MEYYRISMQENSLHIEGFPDAVKIIQIDGHEAEQLADYSLHKTDLEFADACLDAINHTPAEHRIARKAIWRSAIIHFMKCFCGEGARRQLSPENLCKGESPEVKIIFNYFKNLRNKHIAHDENAYSQSVPGAVLNNGKNNYKIEKIICTSVEVATLDEASYGNLKLLIQKASALVAAKIDALSEKITLNLEKESYEKLLARNAVQFTAPTADQISTNRKPRK